MFSVSQMIMFYTLKHLADSFIHSSFYWLSRCHLLDDTTVDTTCHLLLTWLQVHVGKNENITKRGSRKAGVQFPLCSCWEHEHKGASNRILPVLWLVIAAHVRTPQLLNQDPNDADELNEVYLGGKWKNNLQSIRGDFYFAVFDTLPPTKSKK